jgi:hypothetical protein
MLAVRWTCEIRVCIRVMRHGRLGPINWADRLAILCTRVTFKQTCHSLYACHFQTPALLGRARRAWCCTGRSAGRQLPGMSNRRVYHAARAATNVSAQLPPCIGGISLTRYSTTSWCFHYSPPDCIPEIDISDISDSLLRVTATGLPLQWTGGLSLHLQQQ